MPYFSHTWGADSEEVQYRDIIEKNGALDARKAQKLRGACRQAKTDKLEYIWIDTCCIDKSSSAELEESINSMFRWYQNAKVCYAYLADVTVTEAEKEQQIQVKLASSRWFTRGWTLQELLAPDVVRFFDSEWRFFGTKGTLCLAVETITGIPHEYLQSIENISSASIAQRMSWAAKRVTKRAEDIAYSLLGIFDVSMPAIYGEGGGKAFRRLQKEILNSVTNDDSILSWGLTHPSSPTPSIPGGLLAPSPAFFAGCESIVSRQHSTWNSSKSNLFGAVVNLNLHIHEVTEGQKYGILSCGPNFDSSCLVGIPLATSAQLKDGYMRPKANHCLMFPNSVKASAGLEESVDIVIDEQEAPDASPSTQHWIWAKTPEGGDYSLVEVHPPDRWEQDKGLIATGLKEKLNSMPLTFIRFNRVTELPGFDEPASDFVVALEPKINLSFRQRGSKRVLYCSVMRCERKTILSDVARGFSEFYKKERVPRGRNAEGIGLISPSTTSDGQVAISTDSVLVPSGARFILQPIVRVDSAAYGINATAELRRLEVMSYVLGFVRSRELQLARGKDLDRQVETLSTSRRSAEADLREQKMEMEALAQKMEGVQKQIKETEARIERNNTESHALAVEVAAIGGEQVSLRQKLSTQLSRKEHTATDAGVINESAGPPECWLAWLGYTEAFEIVCDFESTHVPKSRSGRSPLSFAAEAGHMSLVQLMLDRGCDDPRSADNEGKTVLWYAARSGDAAIVKALMDWYKTTTSLDEVIRQSKNGMTPLMVAAGRGHAAIVTALLTYFHDATQRVQYLRTKNVAEETALGYAAFKGHANVVKILLDAEAEEYCPSYHKCKDGATPLGCAIDGGYKLTVEILLSYTVEPDETLGKEDDILTAMKNAQKSGFTSVVDLVRKKVPSLASKLAVPSPEESCAKGTEAKGTDTRASGGLVSELTYNGARPDAGLESGLTLSRLNAIEKEMMSGKKSAKRGSIFKRLVR